MTVLILGTAFTILIIYYFIKQYSYWIKFGIQQEKPLWAIMYEWKTILQLQTPADFIETIYNRFPTTRFTGMYQFSKPILMIKDPEIIKQVTTKDFEHFVDHRNFLPGDIDPLWGKNLLVLQGKKWRDMRSVLSPSFTSSKLKTMFVLIKDYAENVAEHLLKRDQNVCKVEVKDLFTRITVDVIATTSFGITVDSLSQPNNEFYVMGMGLVKFTIRSILIIFGAPYFKEWFKRLNVKFFPKKMRTYFQNIVNESIRIREEKEIERPDMINLLIQAKRESKKANGVNQDGLEESATGKSLSNLTNEDIVAQAVLFFFGGFDSVSNLMCFASYELAMHQDVQARLRKEIQNTLIECEGSLTYDSIPKMKYMDMVISEALRKWPSFVFADRQCTKDYTLNPKTADEKPVHLKTGSTILLPIYGLHRDPKYYPDPERFDPERFNDENRAEINPYAYLPFGLGPRGCIGSRFALVEIKTVLFYILLNFEVIPIEDTDIPVKVSKKAFTMQPDGLKLGFKRIVK